MENSQELNANQEDPLQQKTTKEAIVKETHTNQKLNPLPLGLFGFALTTILLNLHNAGVFGPNNATPNIAIVAMGLFIGGIAQIIAGILAFKLSNTFSGTAFVAYGLFWWSLVFIWINPFFDSGIANASSRVMGFYMLGWGLFTALMFIAELKHNVLSRVVFGTLTILFLVLSVAYFTQISWIKTTAGIIGIICGLFAFYSGLAQVINAELGRKIFPIF